MVAHCRRVDVRPSVSFEYTARATVTARHEFHNFLIGFLCGLSRSFRIVPCAIYIITSVRQTGGGGGLGSLSANPSVQARVAVINYGISRAGRHMA